MSVLPRAFVCALVRALAAVPLLVWMGATVSVAQAAPQTGEPVAVRQGAATKGAVSWSPAEILRRADELSEKGRLKEAVYLYERYLEDHPDSGRALFGLARCREGLGETEAARRLYRRAGEIDPSLGGAEPEASDPPAADSGIAASATPQPAAGEPPATEPGAADVLGPDVLESDAMESDAVEAAAPQPAAAEPSASEPARSGEAEAVSPPSPPPAPEPSAVGVSTAGGSPGAGVESAPPLSEERGEDGGEPREAAGETPWGTVLDTVWDGLLLTVLLATIVLLLARRRRGARQAPVAEHSIEGRLEQISLPDVLQLLAAGRKEGRLEISANTGGGEIWVDDGRIVAARYGGEKGEPALYGLLSLARGTFAFDEGRLPSGLQRDLDLTVQGALLDWAQRVDDANRGKSRETALDLDTIEDDALNIELPF